MIETVASADMLIDEVMRVKKNHLAPDFATGKEKRLSIVSGVHGDEVAGQYICYEVIRRIKKDFDKLKGISGFDGRNGRRIYGGTCAAGY